MSVSVGLCSLWAPPLLCLSVAHCAEERSAPSYWGSACGGAPSFLSLACSSSIQTIAKDHVSSRKLWLQWVLLSSCEILPYMGDCIPWYSSPSTHSQPFRFTVYMFYFTSFQIPWHSQLVHFIYKSYLLCMYYIQLIKPNVFSKPLHQILYIFHLFVTLVCLLHLIYSSVLGKLAYPWSSTTAGFYLLCCCLSGSSGGQSSAW